MESTLSICRSTIDFLLSTNLNYLSWFPGVTKNENHLFNFVKPSLIGKTFVRHFTKICVSIKTINRCHRYPTDKCHLFSDTRSNGDGLYILDVILTLSRR